MAGAKTPAPPPAAKGVRQIPIVVNAPQAKEVIVTGDFTHWAMDRIKLQRTGNGDWTGTLPLMPGEYQYRLRVDGEWRDHAAATRRVANPFGSENDVLVVS